MLVAIVVLLQE